MFSTAPYKNGLLVLSLEGSGFQEPCLPSRKAEELLTVYWDDLEEVGSFVTLLLRLKLIKVLDFTQVWKIERRGGGVML